MEFILKAHVFRSTKMMKRQNLYVKTGLIPAVLMAGCQPAPIQQTQSKPQPTATLGMNIGEPLR